VIESRRWFDAEKGQKAVGELTGHECRRMELEKLRQREWRAKISSRQNLRALF